MLCGSCGGFCCVLCRCCMCVSLLCRYVAAFQSGFDAGLSEVQLLFMQSDGGLAPVNAFSGHKAILSGPAGVWAGVEWEGGLVVH